jgi:hypothetical protein
MDLDQLVARERENRADQEANERNSAARFTAQLEAARLEAERKAAYAAELEARRIAETDAKITADAAHRAAIEAQPILATLQAVVAALKCNPHYGSRFSTGPRTSDHGLVNAIDAAEKCLAIYAAQVDPQ